jgi:branched-chain amino acid transport system substrate-binding protein
MRTKSLLVFVVLVTALALAGCGPGAYECTDEWGCAEFEPGQTLKIAYVGPNTGDYSAFGTDMSRCAELAIKDHPQVKGFDLEFLSEDTQGSPEQGAAVANKLAADSQVVGISGHTFSGSTEAAIPIYHEAGKVMVSASATNPGLTQMAESDVFNRVAFTDKMQGDHAAAYIFNTLGVKKIAVMHDGGAYGQGLAEITAENYEGLGGEVVGMEAITPGETDYSAPLAAIAAAGPELVYFGGYDADAAVLVAQMPGAGLEGVMFFGCDGTYGTNFINLAGNAAEGAFSTSVPVPESAALDKVTAAYEADYGDEWGALSPFCPHSYDATTLIIDALEKVAIEHGKNLIIPRKALADEVRGTSGHTGLTGEITCTSDGECAAAAVQFMVVENGAWVPAPGQ